jgi:hypothetical protein
VTCQLLVMSLVLRAITTVTAAAHTTTPTTVTVCCYAQYCRYHCCRPGDKASGRAKRKGIAMQDYQFFNKAKLEVLQNKEFEHSERRNAAQALIKELRGKIRKAQAGGEGTHLYTQCVLSSTVLYCHSASTFVLPF